MSGPLESLRTMNDDELAAALQDLGQSVWFPPAPADLADRVVARLAAGEGPARPASVFDRLWGSFGPRPALSRAAILAIVALLVLAGLAAAVVFGLPGIRIVFLGSAPTPTIAASGSPGATSTAPPTVPPLGSDLAPGQPTTPDAARASTDYPVLVASDPALGAADAVYLDGSGALARVTFVYGARPEMPLVSGATASSLLTEFRGAVNQDAFTKLLGGGTTIEPVSVDGARGFWISGEPHEVLYAIPGGEVWDPIRLAGNVLIWERDGLTFRLETSADKATALRIAASMR
jgi:hypothetical protein